MKKTLILIRLWLLLSILSGLLLVACDSEAPPPRPTATPVPENTSFKTDSLLADLLVKFKTGGDSALDGVRQLARDSGLLDEQDRIRFSLTLDKPESVDGVKAQLKTLGAITTASSDKYLAARVSLSQLVETVQGKTFWENLGQLQAVRDLKITIAPPETQEPSSNDTGKQLTGADRWQLAGYKGKGVRVGVIDSGFKGYQSYLGTALPGAGQVVYNSFLFNGGEGKEQHGIQVAEVVHSLAPDASLFLASIEDEVSFAQAVDWMILSRVQIIQVSLAWGGLWPSDGSSLISRKLEEARKKGVLPVVAAGNYGQAHYVGQFKPDTNGFNQFTNGTMLKVTPETGSAWVSLRWEEDWNNPATNLDLFILDENRQPLASSRNIQGSGSPKPPVELAPFKTSPGKSYYIQVRSNSNSAENGVRFHLFTYNATIEENNPEESIAAPADAKGAIAVGAISGDKQQVEEYSSRGPTADKRTKPELAAPTGVSLLSLATGAQFSGTSASAPQVSGLAAIIWGIAPDFTADQVETYLRRNALPLDNSKQAGAGYGRTRLGPLENIQGGAAELLGADTTGPVVSDKFTNSQDGLPDNILAYYGQLPDGSAGYFVRVGEPNEINWSVYQERDYNEFQADFSAHFPGTDPAKGYFYGLVFWLKSPSDYYLFCISNNRYAILQRNGNNWREIIPWGRNSLLANQQAMIKLRLEATTGYLRIKAGETTLQSIGLEGAKPGGKIGFASGSFGFAEPGGKATGAVTLTDLPLAVFTELAITPLSSK